MAGPGCDQLARAGVILGGLHGKDFFPVGPIAILDAQSDGSADGLAVANPGKNLGSILLDFLAAAATVAQLAAVQLGVDELEVDGELRGKAGKVCEKRLSVRFAGGIEFQHPRLSTRVSFDNVIRRRDSLATAAFCVQQAPLPYLCALPVAGWKSGDGVQSERQGEPVSVFRSPTRAR